MRLRQIALVAEKLEPALTVLTRVLGVKVAYRDPKIIHFGLENALMPFGGNFLEVVAPIQDGTTAGRYLERRGGNGGYMVILQCPDALAQRERILGTGIRSVFNIDNDEYRATHFHPRDLGNFLLSVDSVKPGEDFTDPMCMWEPAGNDWRDFVSTELVSEMTGTELQSENPDELAALWSKALDLPLTESPSGQKAIALLNGTLKFVKDTDGRGPGVGAIDLKVVDTQRILDAAQECGCDFTDNQVTICGTRFNLL
jgi:hypothetical protein